MSKQCLKQGKIDTVAVAGGRAPLASNYILSQIQSARDSTCCRYGKRQGYVIVGCNMLVARLATDSVLLSIILKSPIQIVWNIFNTIIIVLFVYVQTRELAQLPLKG